MSKRISLDKGWKFHEGDIAADLPYWGFIKAGTHNQTPAYTEYDDSLWPQVDLPHDFVMFHDVTKPQTQDRKNNMIHGMEYLSDLHVARGCREGGVAWYRKKIRVNTAGKRVYLRFDGIYRESEVYVNNFLAGRHRSGYAGVTYDITDFLYDDRESTIAVRVDATGAEGWFYEGGGIYRHVWLIVTPELAFAQNGIFVSSQVDVKEKRAELVIESEILNTTEQKIPAEMSYTVYAPDGTACASTETCCIAERCSVTKTAVKITLANVRLWDIEDPALYTIRCCLNGDEELVTFGIRKIEFTPQHGFFLNDKPLKLKGVCCHQDHAGLGVALPDGMFEYRVRKVKEMGANAWRCAHNPAADELLIACDRLGLLVMDEQRLLCSAKDEMEQLTDMIRGARNHPSVILWSIGNEEVNIQFTKEGCKNAKTLKKLAHKLDPTRSVTAAVCMWEAGHLGETVWEPEKQGMLVPGLDVFGFNYFPDIWDEFHKTYPKLPLVVTEDSSFTGTRACRKTDDMRCHYNSMQHGSGGWPYRAGEKAWKEAADRVYLAGTFIWTGFDYHGEPSPYGYPAMCSQFGIMDLCGFPKDMYYYYKAWWSSEKVLHICRDENEIWCMSNYDEVELFGDDVSLGRRSVERNSLIVYETKKTFQTIRAVGYDAYGEIQKEILWYAQTAADHLEVQVDHNYMEKDQSRTVVLNISIADTRGQTVETADDCIWLTFEPQSAVRLLGTGNGDPSDHGNVKIPARKAFGGRMQAVLSVRGEQSKVTITADRFKPVVCEI